MPTATEQPPKVSQASLLAATWSLFAIAVLFFLARIAIRLKISRRLYFDDAWASLALLILLGLALVLTVAIPSMYQVLNVGAGLAKPDTNFMKNATFYLKLQFALTYLYWSCLWAVKACFLSFYHRLTKNLKYCRQVWWATVIISVLSYIGAIITYPVSCSSFVLGQCESQIHISRSLVSLRYSTAVDIITDALIIALPLYLAFRVQRPLLQKLALGGIFSLGIVIIIFAIIRIAVTNQHNSHPETSWLNLWSQIEASVAVVISSLAPFKSFFSRRKMNSSDDEMSPKGPRLSTHPTAIQLDERSREIAVHQNGTIEFAGRGDSTERILRGYEVT